MMYVKELEAITRANRLRVRTVQDDSLIDLASNDYLGLASKKELLRSCMQKIEKFKCHAPRSSQLVNGYHQIHKDFEEYLCYKNGFEDAILAGSGFLANMALLETLPRRGDILIIDDKYHASGLMASKLTDAKVILLPHNNAKELDEILTKNQYKRAIVAVEGIYSMSGNILNKEIFQVINEHKNTLLIIDEAHSSGVLGSNFLGVFDYFDIKPQSNYIKMGTLGKAYGSYGAYILASKNIINFLQNRAKSIIYTTAPSLLDISLAHEGMKYISIHKEILAKEIKKRQKLVLDSFNIEMKGLIFIQKIDNSQTLMKIYDMLRQNGFLLGAIRPPTVQIPLLRVIPRVDISIDDLKTIFTILINELKYQNGEPRL